MARGGKAQDVKTDNARKEHAIEAVLKRESSYKDVKPEPQPDPKQDGKGK